MKVAKICKKWELPIYANLENESSLSLHDRSYIHYVAEHQSLVSAKCWATEWGLKNIIDDSLEYSSREYFAGVGVMTTIIDNLFKIKTHVLSERDPECRSHLLKNGYNCNLEDAKHSLLERYNYDLKFLDFPNSSIVQIQKKWKGALEAVFSTSPKLVMLTDTSVTYPISIHGKNYSQCLEVDNLSSKDDYVRAYSNWLFRNYSYSIKRAAYRDRNAVYFFILPGKQELEIEHFKTSSDGFYFIGEGGINDYT